MTNLAAAFRTRPELARKVGRIVAMAGAVAVPGNAPDHPTAETNAWIDPLALRIVAGSGAPLTLVQLDATNDVPISAFFGGALKRYHYATPEAAAVWDLVQATGPGSSWWQCGDALAVGTCGLVRSPGVTLWQIMGGPREFRGTSAARAELDIEWLWTIRRGGVQDRVVSVEVAAGRLRYSDLPVESWRAIETLGRSAVESVLDEENPPGRLRVSGSGVNPL